MNKAGCISARRWTKVRHILAGGALVALTAYPCLAANTVKDVRFWSVGGVTRVAVEVSGEFRFTAQR